MKEKQKEAKETLQEYNRENNTNLTLEQYNNKYNATLVSRTKGLASELGSFLTGKDATVSQSMESRRQIEDAKKNLKDSTDFCWMPNNPKNRILSSDLDFINLDCLESRLSKVTIYKSGDYIVEDYE